jgi:hypothetical protein
MSINKPKTRKELVEELTDNNLAFNSLVELVSLSNSRGSININNFYYLLGTLVEKQNQLTAQLDEVI